jgi:hypothetical protein
LSNILMKGIDIREANRRQRLAEKSVLGSQGQGQGRGRRRNFLGDEVKQSFFPHWYVFHLLGLLRHNYCSSYDL